MLHFQTFLVLSVLCVGCYTWQVISTATPTSTFPGMAILTVSIYIFIMRLTNGNEMATGLFLFPAPTYGLIVRLMVADGKQQFEMLRLAINYYLESFIIYLSLLKRQHRWHSFMRPK